MHVITVSCMLLIIRYHIRSMCIPPCPVRSDRQTSSLPVADNWIDEDVCIHDIPAWEDS